MIEQTLEERIAALEEEVRDLRLERHSRRHNEPVDPNSKAYVRWEERQSLFARHIVEAEMELTALREQL